MKRDLHADLALCESATPGPWVTDIDGFQEPCVINERSLIASELTYNDAKFIAESREAWPIAIRRAIAAEQKLSHIVSTIERKVSTLDKRIDRRNGPCYFDESETVSRLHSEAYVYEQVLTLLNVEVSADATR